MVKPLRTTSVKIKIHTHSPITKFVTEVPKKENRKRIKNAIIPKNKIIVSQNIIILYRRTIRIVPHRKSASPLQTWEEEK